MKISLYQKLSLVTNVFRSEYSKVVLKDELVFLNKFSLLEMWKKTCGKE